MINLAYFREENPNYIKPNIKESNGGLLPCWNIIDFDEDDEEGPSPAKDNRIDPLEIKENDLLIYSLIVPRFSLNNNK